MRFDVISIFPEFFDSALRVSLVAKAIGAGLLQVDIHDLREWAPGPHRKVDDAPFGGGAGMVMTPGPVVEAVEAVRRPGSPVVSLTAAGRQLDQNTVHRLAGAEQLVLVCGRYEGMDERIAEETGAQEISIGPYVLAGGEAPALVVIESVARLIPGVLGNEESLSEESFVSGLVEYPHYTRPADFRGRKVPDVLVSGDHGRVSAWRRRQALWRTFLRWPQLLDDAELSEDERVLLEQWQRDA
ncbi:MAG: tRNA (guanosine(37)-N1)-methyltransferase TrmD [Actinomycetota bacterium]